MQQNRNNASPSLEQISQKYTQIVNKTAAAEEQKRRQQNAQDQRQQAFEDGLRQTVVNSLRPAIATIAKGIQNGQVDDALRDIGGRRHLSGRPELFGKQIIGLAFPHPDDVARNEPNPQMCRFAFYRTGNERCVRTAFTYGWIDRKTKACEYTETESYELPALATSVVVQQIIVGRVNDMLDAINKNR